MNRCDLRLTPFGLLAFGRMLPCSIGTGGLRGDKREGDGATPLGTHKIASMYYRADRVAAPNAWAVPIGPRDLWSDDVNDAAYNRPVQAPYAPSHETMRRADPLYDIVIVLDWNLDNPVPGKGSAIFVHQWRRPGYPTEGCIALARPHLIWLAGRVHVGSRVRIPALSGSSVSG